MAGQRALGRLREVELHAHATGSQHHATDHAGGGGVAGGEGASHVGTGAIADRTRRVGLRHAVDRIAARLLLGDGVAVLVGRREVVELVVAIGRGLDSDRHGIAVEISTAQGHVNPADAGVGAVLVAIVVVIDEDPPAQGGGPHLHDGGVAVVARIRVVGNLVAVDIHTRLDLHVVGTVGVVGRRSAAVIDARNRTRPQRDRDDSIGHREHAAQVTGHLLEVRRQGHLAGVVGDVTDAIGAVGGLARHHRQRTNGGAVGRHSHRSMGTGGQPLEAGRQVVDDPDLVGRVDALVVDEQPEFDRLGHIHRGLARIRREGGLGHPQVRLRPHQMRQTRTIVASHLAIERALALRFVGQRLVRTGDRGVAEAHRADIARRAVVLQLDLQVEVQGLTGIQDAVFTGRPDVALDFGEPIHQQIRTGHSGGRIDDRV